MPSDGSTTGVVGAGGVCAAAGATAAIRPETNVKLPTRRRMASPHDPPSQRCRYNITFRAVNPDSPIAMARSPHGAIQEYFKRRRSCPAPLVLLQGGDACLGQQIVLRSGATAHANGADDLAADHQGIAAA